MSYSKGKKPDSNSYTLSILSDCIVCRTQWKMKVWDTKVWDLLFKKYQELHERESRSGVPFDFGALLTLEVTCHWNQSGWLEPTPWELPGIDVPEKWQGGQGESQNASAPYPLRVSEHSGHWRSRAPSEDILRGALPSASASNLLCAIH